MIPLTLKKKEFIAYIYIFYKYLKYKIVLI